MSKISTEESPAGQDCTAMKAELPFEATRRSRRILQAGKYPPGELVIPVDSGTIGFSSKAENA